MESEVSLIRITAPHFVAGVEVRYVGGAWLPLEDDHYDNRCAPIVKYMRDWSPARIRGYCKKMGWAYRQYF